MHLLTDEQVKNEVNIFLSRVESGDNNPYIFEYTDEESDTEHPYSVAFFTAPDNKGRFILVRYLGAGSLYSSDGYWCADENTTDFYDASGSSKIDGDIMEDYRKKDGSLAVKKTLKGSTGEVKEETPDASLTTSDLRKDITDGVDGSFLENKYERDVIVALGKELEITRAGNKGSDTLLAEMKAKLTLSSAT